MADEMTQAEFDKELATRIELGLIGVPTDVEPEPDTVLVPKKTFEQWFAEQGAVTGDKPGAAAHITKVPAAHAPIANKGKPLAFIFEHQPVYFTQFTAAQLLAQGYQKDDVRFIVEQIGLHKDETGKPLTLKAEPLPEPDKQTAQGTTEASAEGQTGATEGASPTVHASGVQPTANVKAITAFDFQTADEEIADEAAAALAAQEADNQPDTTQQASDADAPAAITVDETQPVEAAPKREKRKQ